jgi:hypothetical protein
MRKKTSTDSQFLNLTAEIFKRQKTKEKLHKAQLVSAKKPSKVTILARPITKLGQICKRLEDIKTKNLKCIKTLSKYEESPSNQSWHSAFMQVDATHSKIRTIGSSKKSPQEFRRPRSAHAYYQENTYHHLGGLQKTVPKQALTEGRRIDIVSLNQNLKRLLQKTPNPPTFSQLRQKAIQLGLRQAPSATHESTYHYEKDKLSNKLSLSLNKSRNLNFSSIDKGLSLMNESQLVSLKDAIDHKLRAIKVPKDSDSDSTFEVQLAEKQSDDQYTDMMRTRAHLIKIEGIKTRLRSKGRVKALEESIPLIQHEVAKKPLCEQSILESQSEVAINEHLLNHYGNWLK